MTDYQPAAAIRPLSPSDENLWSTLAHVGNIIGILPSLLIFLILGPRSERVKQESREALNWVITVAIAEVALLILWTIVGAIAATAPRGIDLLFGLIAGLVWLVIFAVGIVNVVFSIVAATRVSSGGSYRYPFALRLVK